MSLEADEVRGQLRSIEGRKTLIAQLRSNPKAVEALEKGGYSMEALQRDLDLASADLAAEQRFLESQAKPEKKGLFRTAWDTITWLPRKHPIITVALLGVVLGAVASYMGWIPRIDFPGLWGRAQGWLGWGANGEAAGETVGEAAAVGEAATEGAASTAPIGTEIPLESMIADDFKMYTIRPFEFNGAQHYLYNNEIFTMEELPTLMKKLPMAAEGYVKHPEFTEVVRVLPFASARPSGEIALTEALEKLGIEWHFPSFGKFEDLKDFVPDPVKYPKFAPMPLQLPE